jgi:hypothetical protein
MAAPTPFTLAALKAEIMGGPLAASMQADVQAGNHGNVAATLNTIQAGTFVWQPSPIAEILAWGAPEGVLTRISQAAAATGPYAPRGVLAITSTAQSIAIAVGYLLGGATPALDFTDPSIVGAMADGSPYTPGAGALATPGMLDALVAAGVLVDGSSPPTSLKDPLINVGRMAASRPTVLWGYSLTTNPSYPQATPFVVDHLIVAQALRS